MTCSVFGAEIHLTWNPNPESDIAGYKVYATNLTTTERDLFDVGRETEAFFAPDAGNSYAFAVTAYNLAGLESAPSSEVRYAAPVDALTVTWAPSVFSSVAQYRVSYAQLNQPAQQLSVGTTTSTLVSGLQRGATYYFYVEAFDASARQVDAWQQTTAIIPLDGPLGTVFVPRANLPPQVALTSPSASSTYTAPATITLSANASDLDGTVRTVEFYAGSTRLASFGVAPYNFTWSGVAAGTYQLSAIAVDQLGASTRSASVSVTVKVPVPPAPTALFASCTETSVSLSWSHSATTETGFHVFRSTGSAYSLIATLPANSLGYTNSGLNPATPYLYRVTAFNASGDSVPAEVSVTTKQTGLFLAQPLNVSAAPMNGSIVIGWSPVAGATQYYVERSTSQSGPFVSLGNAGITQWTDSTASVGVVYYYRVIAGADSLRSVPSQVVNAMLQGTPPAAPAGFSASAGKNLVKLSWHDVSNDENSFIVERSLDGSSFTQIATLPVNTTRFNDGSVSPRRRYYYRVAAGNASGVSFSSIVSTQTR